MPTPLHDPAHRAALAQDARAQIAFFRAALNRDGGFDALDLLGRPIADQPQELHCTTRMVHSYALAHAWGAPDCAPVLDAGMAALWACHRDQTHGGYGWSVMRSGFADGTKLAYGHVFVLLAAASALSVGHDDAVRLLVDIDAVIDRHFWDDAAGRLREEYHADWTGFSSYRGMNANMHGAEAFLAAYEATGQAKYLDRAGRILEFFSGHMAAQHRNRIPEHYTEIWLVDPTYHGNPMFRPAGTTPGHALEFARLLVQYWDIGGRSDPTALPRARALVDTALSDAWLSEGGLAYTVDADGRVLVSNRYWWPVTEAMGALAALIKVDPRPSDADWYLRLWEFAQGHFIDYTHGGWFPEIGMDGTPLQQQFIGKPDIYHSLQAVLFPLCDGVSHMMAALPSVPERGSA
jgi:sulfoquinovose isomerase